MADSFSSFLGAEDGELDGFGTGDTGGGGDQWPEGSEMSTEEISDAGGSADGDI